MKLSEHFFKNFLFSKMPLSVAAILPWEQKQKIFEMPQSLILINFYAYPPYFCEVFNYEI